MVSTTSDESIFSHHVSQFPLFTLYEELRQTTKERIPRFEVHLIYIGLIVLALSPKNHGSQEVIILYISISLSGCEYSVELQYQSSRGRVERGRGHALNTFNDMMYSTGLNVSRCHRHSKVLWATPRVCSSKCLPPHIPEPHWMWQVLDKYVKLAECQSCRSWLWVALKDGSSRPSPAIRRIGL